MQAQIECVEYAGIDYGRGVTNIDSATGIRYGVIPHHAVGSAWYEESEGDYGEPTCPRCGGEVVEFEDEKHSTYNPFGHYYCEEYVCETCEIVLEYHECFPEDPFVFYVKNDEYAAFQDADGPDIFIEKSPYFTYAQFCSPCGPGACYLLNPLCDPRDPDEGPMDNNRAYCFGHNWFESGRAPYPVYSVATNEIVEPEQEVKP